MPVDIGSLGPAAQKQIKEALKKQNLERKANENRVYARNLNLDGMGSNLERDYYTAFILPKMLAGEIASCEIQKRFTLLPPGDYCGLPLPAAHYTPDFFITYKTGVCEAVEVKHKKIRQLQKGYIYRRRIFIELMAKPNGWIFTEYIRED